MTNNLCNYFPMIRTRQEVLKDIRGASSLANVFTNWPEEQQEDFLDFSWSAMRLLFSRPASAAVQADTGRKEKSLQLQGYQKGIYHCIVRKERTGFPQVSG